MIDAGLRFLTNHQFSRAIRCAAFVQLHSKRSETLYAST